MLIGRHDTCDESAEKDSGRRQLKCRDVSCKSIVSNNYFPLILTRFIVANRNVGTGLVASAVVSVRSRIKLPTATITNLILVLAMEHHALEYSSSGISIWYQWPLLVWGWLFAHDCLLRLSRDCVQNPGTKRAYRVRSREDPIW